MSYLSPCYILIENTFIPTLTSLPTEYLNFIFQGLNPCHHDTSVYIDDRDCGPAERCCIQWVANTFILAVGVYSTTEAEESRRRPIFRIDGIENITDNASSKASRDITSSDDSPLSFMLRSCSASQRSITEPMVEQSLDTRVRIYMPNKIRRRLLVSDEGIAYLNYSSPACSQPNPLKTNVQEFAAFFNAAKCPTREAGAFRPSIRESIQA